ncbi:MAG: reverse transcriptase family protein [Candidatus Thiodiazotropha sp.]
MKSSLRIGSWNIEGLAKHEHNTELIEYVKQFDIYSFCETWGHTKTMFDEFINGYKAFTNIRIKRKKRGRNSGGVTVFVRCSLVENGNVKQVFSEFKDCVVLLCKGCLFNKKNDIVMLFPYVSPEGSPIYNETDGINGIEILEDYLLQIVLRYPDASLLVAGDLNARCGSLQDTLSDDNIDHIFEGETAYENDYFEIYRKSKDLIQNLFGVSLIDLCKSFSIHIVNGRLHNDTDGEITCTANDGCSVVDYFIVSTNLFSDISDFEVGERSESVHFPLHCTFNFNMSKCNDTENDFSRSDEIFQRYTWKEDRKQQFVDNFKRLYIELKSRLIITIGNSLDESLNIIVNLYQNAAKCMISNSSRQKRIQEPWWDRQCAILKKQKYMSLKQFRRQSTTNNLTNYIEIRNKFKLLCHNKKSEFQCKNRNELVSSRKDMNLFWKTVKKFKPKKTEEADITCDQWFNHFKTLLYDGGIVGRLENLDNNNNNNNNDDSLLDDYFNEPFSMDELTSSVNKLKLGKAGGPDGILSEMIKSTCSIVAPVLLSLYNRILELGNFPEPWGKSVLCPLYKAGSLTDPNNFRGISLIDVLNKVLTGMMHNRLYMWAEENNKISEAQAGFRKGYSAIDNLFVLMSMGQKYLSKKGGRFYCIFIDFSKAFDRVDHLELFESLRRKGVTGKFMTLLVSMYSQLCSCVKLNNQSFTKYFSCNIGTRQGCKLSPILFSLFINDLIDDLKQSGVRGIHISNNGEEILAIAYADDFAEVSDSVRALQIQIDITSRFCDRTKMKVNLSKTKIIVFRNGGFLRDMEKWFFKGEEIQAVSSYKYMGLSVTPKLIWTRAKDTLAIQARKSIVSLLKLQNSIGYFEFVDLFKLFDTMVKPVLCYAAEIWGFEYSDIIENVQDRFCKKYLKLPAQTFHAFVRGECGRYPVFVDYVTRCIKYWIRLTRMDKDRYPYQCYKMLRNLDNVGRITWASKVRNILFRYGFGYVWIHENVGDVNIFLKAFKQRLIDCGIQEWRMKINDSSKARYYRYFIDALKTPNYIHYNIPLKFRIALSRLRCSVHSLRVETGRHNNIPYEERLCILCNRHAVEDELHFVLFCPAYSHLRLLYLPQLIDTYSDVTTFNNLMNSSQLETLNLSKFVYYAFKHRNEMTDAIVRSENE